MDHGNRKSFLVDWGGILAILAFVAGLAFYFAHEIRRDLAAIESAREDLARKVAGARAEHAEIRADHRAILDHLVRIEARMDRDAKEEAQP